MKSFLKYYKGDVYLQVHSYDANPECHAIKLVTLEGEPVCTATSYFDDLREGEVAIKDYSENEGVLETLLEAGVITNPPLRFIKSGFVSFPVYHFEPQEEEA